VGAVIAALVNILKTFKVVTDATAGRWFAGLNLVAIAGLVYLKLFQPDIAIEYVDAQAAVLAQILVFVLGYIVQLGSGLGAHSIFADLRLPYIGKSSPGNARRRAPETCGTVGTAVNEPSPFVYWCQCAGKHTLARHSAYTARPALDQSP
jgi:hypothetical protein